MEYKSGLMELFIKDCGIITKPKVKEPFGMLKEIYTLVISCQIRQTDLVSILM